MSSAKFLGVYSARVPRTKQTQVFGGTQSTTKKQLYFIWQSDEEQYHQQAIDNAFKPIGKFEDLAQNDFYSKYVFEGRIQVAPKVHYTPEATKEKKISAENAEFVPLDKEKARALANSAKNEAKKVNVVQSQFAQSHATTTVKNISKNAGTASAKVPSSQPLNVKSERINTSHAVKSSEKKPLNKEFTDVNFSGNYIDLLNVDEKDVEKSFNESFVDEKEQISNAQLLEMELREIFSLQIAKFKHDRAKKYEREIEAILKKEDGVVEEHRYMFNSFGIDLRKVRLYNLAKLAFTKAKELKETDPNIWFNLSRIHYELREYRVAMECIDASLKIEPDHEYALRMKKAIIKAINPSPIIL